MTASARSARAGRARSELADKPTQIERVNGSNLAQVLQIAAESAEEAFSELHSVGALELTAPPFSLRELSESGRPEPPPAFRPELAYITAEFSEFLDELCGSQSDRAALSLERASARCAAGGIRRPKGEK